MAIFGQPMPVPPPAPPKPPSTCAEIDRLLGELVRNRLRWHRCEIHAFDPVEARRRIDELLELRFWHAHAEDLATLSEWGDMGP